MTTVSSRGPALRRRPPAGTGPRRRRAPKTGLVAAAFLAPAVLALVLLRIVPALESVVSSLFHDSFVSGGEVWVGLQNYIDLLGDHNFVQSVGVTLLFSLIVNPVQIVVSLALAVLYTQRAAGSRIWRSLVILPIAAPPAVTAIIWSAIYRPDGLANSMLALVGIGSQPFLTSVTQAMPALIVLLSWTGVGYWMMFLIAGIHDVPLELHEAAALDGASSWTRLWRITVPLLRRPLAFVLVADTVSNFLVFAPVQILTKGGPQGSTNLLMYDIYSRAYTLDDINSASAEVVILVAITLIIVAVQFRLLRSTE